jgi:hypothetical protein
VHDERAERQQGHTEESETNRRAERDGLEKQRPHSCILALASRLNQVRASLILVTLTLPFARRLCASLDSNQSFMIV